MSNPTQSSFACQNCGCGGGSGQYRRLRDCATGQYTHYWVSASDALFSQFLNPFIFWRQSSPPDTVCLNRPVNGESSQTLPGGAVLLRPVLGLAPVYPMHPSTCAAGCCPSCILQQSSPNPENSVSACKILLSLDWTSCGCVPCGNASGRISSGTSAIELVPVGDNYISQSCEPSVINHNSQGTAQCFADNSCGILLGTTQVGVTASVRIENRWWLEPPETLGIRVDLDVGARDSAICVHNGVNLGFCFRGGFAGELQVPKSSFVWGSVFDVPKLPWQPGQYPGIAPCAPAGGWVFQGDSYYPVVHVTRLSMALL